MAADGTHCGSGAAHVENPDTTPVNICDPGYLSCLTDADCVDQSCRGFTCEPRELYCALR